MPSLETASMVERYGVYWVRLDPVMGSEISKTRPAVVVSDDDMNAALATVVVCPLTSRLHPHWPFRVQTTVNKRRGEIAVDQIRTVDTSRLVEKIDTLKPVVAEEVRHVITQMYGILSVS
jgi:mRNA interferase MazF